MKRFILTLTIAALLAPGLSFAQDSWPRCSRRAKKS